MTLQADSLKKRGSVKAETSLSAVEMSGKVMRRGYLLKQVQVSFFKMGVKVSQIHNGDWCLLLKSHG